MSVFGLLRPVFYSNTRSQFLFRPLTRCLNSRLQYSTKSLFGSSILYYDAPKPIDVAVANQTLVTLVESEQFGAADRIRLHILEEQIDIKPNLAFEKAAVAAFLWEGDEGRMEKFTAWLSLIPDCHQQNLGSGHLPLKLIRKALFESGAPSKNAPIIMQFGRICASKGYLGYFFREVCEVIVRYAKPRESAQCLIDMEREARLYELHHYPEHAEHVALRYRKAAVEVCCQAGWLTDAIWLLKRKRDFAIPNVVYENVLERLKNADGTSKAIRNVRRLQRLDKESEENRIARCNFTDGY